MPIVKCPIPGCSYETGDMDPAIVAALITTHSFVHTGTSGQVSSTPSPNDYEEPPSINEKEAAPSAHSFIHTSTSGQVSSTPSPKDYEELPSINEKEAAPSASVSQSIKSTSVHLSKWPIPFTLPKTFRPQLTSALSEDRALNFDERRSLMDSLYDEMTKYTFRPTKAQYQEVTHALLRKYPSLMNGLVGKDAVVYWKKVLSDKFRNGRKRHEKDNPLAKAPVPKKSKEPQKSSKGVSKYGILNYMPERPEGETDETIKKHIVCLQLESTKTRQDMQKISALMDITLADRREAIVSERWPIRKIKDTFPCLFNEEEMLAEFDRLTGWEIENRMKEGLQKYGKSVLFLAGKGTTPGTKGTSMVEEVSSLEENKQDSAILLLIPSLLGEKLGSIICSQSEVVATPVYLEHSKDDMKSFLQDAVLDAVDIKVIADGEDVCTSTKNTLLRAFCLYFATHYVFDMNYTKKVNLTMTFIQKVILKLNDNITTPSRIVKLLYDINTHLSSK